MAFDPDSVRVEPIRDDTEYGGMRVKLAGSLAGARVPIQAGIGMGDAVTPDPQEITYPVLLDGPAPELLSYPRETVVAEKLQAIVAFGIANSRMKDYYDLWVTASRYRFDGDVLARALGNTFDRRHTELPDRTPVGLSAEFAGDPRTNTQWGAFLSRISGDVPATRPALAEVCAQLERFLGAPICAARQGMYWQASWPPGGPWS